MIIAAGYGTGPGPRPFPCDTVIIRQIRSFSRCEYNLHPVRPGFRVDDAYPKIAKNRKTDNKSGELLSEILK